MRINKIKNIKKIKRCPCGKGNMKLRMIYVHPKSGKVALSYANCSAPFCSYERGILEFTDIIIPELKMGE